MVTYYVCRVNIFCTFYFQITCLNLPQAMSKTMQLKCVTDAKPSPEIVSISEPVLERIMFTVFLLI